MAWTFLLDYLCSLTLFQTGSKRSRTSQDTGDITAGISVFGSCFARPHQEDDVVGAQVVSADVRQGDDMDEAVGAVQDDGATRAKAFEQEEQGKPMSITEGASVPRRSPRLQRQDMQLHIQKP
ncbi:hypothetical protein WJX82_010495 [Trebouxia sp. C0006]